MSDQMDDNAEGISSEEESELSSDSEEDLSADNRDLRSVAEDALACAANCLQKQDYGKAFACYLLAGKIIPSCKEKIRKSFTRTLLQWIETLTRLGREDDVLSCCTQACDVFPENEHSWISYGSALSSRGLYLEALEPLETAVRLSPVSPRARESLHGVLNYLLERWHFRMLNDCERNRQYELALRRAIAEGHTTVLDIGSGSGILSMMAARAGASEVYGCDMSELLVNISKDVIAANGYADHIKIHHLKSTDLIIPQNLPQRVSLVVTETVDSGLLGEFTIPTLRHAWKHLLLPPAPWQSVSDSVSVVSEEKVTIEGDSEHLPTAEQLLTEANSKPATQYGRVIPSSATVFAFVVECPAVRYHSRLSKTNVAGVDMSGFLFIGSSHLEDIESETTNLPKRVKRKTTNHSSVNRTAEPYTTEELAQVRQGFQSLTHPSAMLSFDFNNPEVPLPPPCVAEVTVDCCGWCDAIAMYFQLNLDEFGMLSTALAAQPAAWEQAIFPVTCDLLPADCLGSARACSASTGSDTGSGLWLCRGDVVSLAGSCTESLISLRVVGVKRSSQSSSIVPHPSVDHQHRLSECVREAQSSELFVSSQDRSAQGARHDLLSSTYKENCVVYIDRPDLARLNDTSYWSVWQEAISVYLQSKEHLTSATCNQQSSREPFVKKSSLSWGDLPQTAGGHSFLSISQRSARTVQRILDLTHGLPLTSILALNTGANVTVCCGANELLPTLQQLAQSSHADRLFLSSPVEQLSAATPQWDIIVADLISPCGLLYGNSLEQLSMASRRLRSGGAVLPCHLRLYGVCVDCPTLRAHASVLGTVPTLGFDIARFINRYQVNTHVDLNLLSLPHTALSTKVNLLSIDLAHLPEHNQSENGEIRSKTTVHAIGSGSLTAVVFWFELELTNSLTITNQPSTDVTNHWHQAAIVLDEDCPVTAGKQLLLETVCEDSCISIAVCNT